MVNFMLLLSFLEQIGQDLVSPQGLTQVLRLKTASMTSICMNWNLNHKYHTHVLKAKH